MDTWYYCTSRIHTRQTEHQWWHFYLAIPFTWLDESLPRLGSGYVCSCTALQTVALIAKVSAYGELYVWLPRVNQQWRSTPSLVRSSSCCCWCRQSAVCPSQLCMPSAGRGKIEPLKSVHLLWAQCQCRDQTSCPASWTSPYLHFSWAAGVQYFLPNPECVVFDLSFTLATALLDCLSAKTTSFQCCRSNSLGDIRHRPSLFRIHSIFPLNLLYYLSQY